MPEPVDEMHAGMIAEFFGSKPSSTSVKNGDELEETPKKPPEYDDDGAMSVGSDISFDDV